MQQSEKLSAIELCAGGGGQAIGIERAGFDHSALVEIDYHACETLKLNRPTWNVINKDIREFDPSPYLGVDLIAAGLPCPPFSIAGKGLGWEDERDLFPPALKIIDKVRPKAVMIENVKGFLSPKFEAYRNLIEIEFIQLGYFVQWKVFDASKFDVCQSRNRVIIVALKFEFAENFSWPEEGETTKRTVGSELYNLMKENGWKSAKAWKKNANGIAPTIVGGSKKHGGPDLGPTGAKKAWSLLGVNGKGISDSPPEPDFVGSPKLTVDMVAKLQGFPESWKFFGKKTNSYRQVGNAFPPPVAEAVAKQILEAIAGQSKAVKSDKKAA